LLQIYNEISSTTIPIRKDARNNYHLQGEGEKKNPHVVKARAEISVCSRYLCITVGIYSPKKHKDE